MTEIHDQYVFTNPAKTKMYSSNGASIKIATLPITTLNRWSIGSLSGQTQVVAAVIAGGCGTAGRGHDLYPVGACASKHIVVSGQARAGLAHQRGEARLTAATGAVIRLTRRAQVIAFWMTPPKESYTLHLEDMRAIADTYNRDLMNFAIENGHLSCDVAAAFAPTADNVFDGCHFTTLGASRRRLPTA